MNRIMQVKQVFPEALMAEVHEVIGSVPWRYGWKSNDNIPNGHWNHDFTLARMENGLDISHQLPEELKRAWQHIQATYLGPQTLLRCYTNSHTFGIEGYLHVDSRREVDNTLVVYMNKQWSRDWGGETTVYSGDDIIHAELPKYNNGLIFPGAQTHCARSVTRICPAQRITLMFKFARPNNDPVRDKIQLFLTAIGADKIAHNKGKLLGHLLRTYDILTANGWDQDTASAGGMHSVFGTNIFKHVTLDPEHRSLAVQVIGESAVELVELFRDVARPGALVDAVKNNSLTVELNAGGTRVLTQHQLNSICAIEAANLSDQKSLHRFETLNKYLKK